VHRRRRVASTDPNERRLKHNLRTVARPKRDRAIESELKFRVSGPEDHHKLRLLLRERGAKVGAHYREENYRFNGPGKSTRNTSLRLRVLNGGPHGVLTAKGPATFDGGVKSREETEIDVKDVHATLDLLEQLGFRVAWTYPKRRSVWVLDGVAVTLDVLDFGYFVEFEGPASALPEMARSLGLDPADATRDSYSAMARKHMKRQPATRTSGMPVSTLAPRS